MTINLTLIWEKSEYVLKHLSKSIAAILTKLSSKSYVLTFEVGLQWMFLALIVFFCLMQNRQAVINIPKNLSSVRNFNCPFIRDNQNVCGGVDVCVGRYRTTWNDNEVVDGQNIYSQKPLFIMSIWRTPQKQINKQSFGGHPDIATCLSVGLTIFLIRTLPVSNLISSHSQNGLVLCSTIEINQI